MSRSAAFFAVPSHCFRSQHLGWADSWTSRRPWLSVMLVLTGLLLEPTLSFSQAAKPLPATSATAATSDLLPLTKTVASDTSWAELTPEQQQALMPLASSWSSIHEPQKRKWLEIAKNYRTLTPDEQGKLKSRMNEWVALSPQQRTQARLNFGKTKELSRQLTPEEKKAKWEAYQALSPEEKQKLAAKASPKPSGAAPATKPVAPQKLAVLPANGNKSAPKSAPKIMALPPALPVSAATATGMASTGAASAAPQR